MNPLERRTSRNAIYRDLYYIQSGSDGIIFSFQQKMGKRIGDVENQWYSRQQRVIKKATFDVSINDESFNALLSLFNRHTMVIGLKGGKAYPFIQVRNWLQI